MTLTISAFACSVSRARVVKRRGFAMESPLLSSESVNKMFAISDIFAVILRFGANLKKNFLLYLFLLSVKNPLCREHLLQIGDGLIKGEEWAIYMYDSMRLIPSGILEGNLVHLGNVDECLLVNGDGDYGTFGGRYCLVQIPLEKTAAGQPLEMETAVCMPSSCSAEDLQDLLRGSFHLNATVNPLSCRSNGETQPYTVSECIAISILSLFLAMVIISTIVDCYVKNPSFRKPWLLAFSSYSNGLQLQSTSSKGVAFPALHGIRTMAMSMVVLANVYKHAMLSRINDNTTVFLKRYLFTIISCSLTFARPGDVALYMLYLAALTLNNKTGMKFLALIWLSDWGHIWLTSRGVGLEVFMVMSGLLVSFYFLEERSKDRHFSLKLYVLRHYLRLTPVFAAMVLIHATLLSRLGTSPRWHHHAVLEEKNCQDDWWKMLLYIHNWWDSKPNECLEQTWFLAANMQLYLLSPLILLPLAWRPKVGLVILSLLLLGGHVTIFCISYLNQVKVDYLRNFNERWTSQFFKATYTRCTSWMTGLALGYFLYLKKQNGYNFNSVALNEKHTFIKKVGLLLIWILALVLCLLPMFMVHPFIQEDYNYKALESAIYLTFARSSFCFGVTIIMALCVLGHGGAINKFLSRGYKFPISRLSFAIYMVHMTVVELLFYDARTSYHASDLLMVQDVLYVLGYSILFAILMTFLFEMPIINLQYLLFDSGKSKRCSHNNSVVLNHEDSPTVQMTEGGLNIASKQ